MKRPSRKTWLALCAVWVGCSSVVDFDRGKIGRGDEDAGTSDDSGVGMDAMVVDARVPDASGEDTAVADSSVDAGGCTANEDCDDNQLCCDSVCRATSASEGCEACGQPCGDNASECSGRSCLCGVSPACSGDTPLCVAPAEGETKRCVECEGDTDCQGNSDGLDQCVGGTCVECDPDDSSSGCQNPEPICDGTSRSCVGCSASRPCANGMQCVDGSCFGCDQNTNAGCVASGSTPVCKPAAGMPGRFECVGCAADGDCKGPNAGRQCVAGACELCDPTPGANNAGCAATSATPICDATTLTCRGCAATGDCGGATPVCAPTGPVAGRCVQCASSAGCTADPTRPFCDTNDGACKACGAVSAVSTDDDAWCVVTYGAMRPVCHPGGRCVPCNTGGAGCTAPTDQCLVNAAEPLDNKCVDCINNAGCAAPNEICNTATNSCVDCAPGSNAGCLTGQQCLAGAMPICVACLDDTDCTGANGRCRLSDHVCVACLGAADCNDADLCTTDTCSTATNTCVNTPLPNLEDGLPCTRPMCSSLGVVTQVSTCMPDAFTCTAPPVCTATGCVETPNDALCGNACLTSTCGGPTAAPVTGCTPGVPVVCEGDAGACMLPGGCPPP